MRATFAVEEAGCSSCASRVRAALAPLATVEAVVLDVPADAATVSIAGEVSEAAVADALEAASEGSGHAYRIRPGSWRTA